MAIKAVAAVVAAVAATVATVGTIENQKQQAKFQRRAARIERDANNYQAARERRAAIREARIAYATQVNASENDGTAFSSGALGGQSSLISQTKDNTTFLDNYRVLKDASAAAQTQANSAAAKAGTFAAVGSLALKVFSEVGGSKAITG